MAIMAATTKTNEATTEWAALGALAGQVTVAELRGENPLTTKQVPDSVEGKSAQVVQVASSQPWTFEKPVV